MLYNLFLLLLFIINFSNCSSSQSSSSYVLFTPYGVDYKCLDVNIGVGLGYIINGDKSCIANNGISITVNVLQSSNNYAEICKYNSNNCKNLLACQSFNTDTCYDPFSSAMFLNSPIPATYTKMSILNNLNDTSIVSYGYNYKQYSVNNNNDDDCNDSNFQYSLFITNNYYLPNKNYPNLSETFTCNKQLDIPQLIINNSTININQTNCINSNNYSNEFNFIITC